MKQVSVRNFGKGNSTRVVGALIYTKNLDLAWKFMNTFVSNSPKGGVIPSAFDDLPDQLLEVFCDPMLVEPCHFAASYIQNSLRVCKERPADYYRTVLRFFSKFVPYVESERILERALAWDISLMRPSLFDMGESTFLSYNNKNVPVHGWIAMVVAAVRNRRPENLHPYAAAIYYYSTLVMKLGAEADFLVSQKPGVPIPKELRNHLNKFNPVQKLTPAADLLHQIRPLIDPSHVRVFERATVIRSLESFLATLHLFCLPVYLTGTTEPPDWKPTVSPNFDSIGEFWDSIPAADKCQFEYHLLNRHQIMEETFSGGQPDEGVHPGKLLSFYTSNEKKEQVIHFVGELHSFMNGRRTFWEDVPVGPSPQIADYSELSTEVTRGLASPLREKVLLSMRANVAPAAPLILVTQDPANVYRGPFSSPPRVVDARMEVFRLFEVAERVIPHTIVRTKPPTIQYWVASPNISPVPIDKLRINYPIPGTGGMRWTSSRLLGLKAPPRLSAEEVKAIYQHRDNLMVMILRYLFDMRIPDMHSDVFATEPGDPRVLFGDVCRPAPREALYNSTTALHQMLSITGSQKPGFVRAAFSAFDAKTVDVVRTLVGEIEENAQNVKDIYASNDVEFPVHFERNMELLKNLI